MSAAAKEFYYRIPWMPRSMHPGNHPAVANGAGVEVDGFSPFGEGEDPRRFDLRAGLRDPLGRLFVRRYRQPAAVQVFVLADLSASMGFIGAGSKQQLLADFIRAAALSVTRNGDSFAFYGAADQLDHRLTRRPARRSGEGDYLAQQISDMTLTGASARGLQQALTLLPSRKALVFLLSDFYWPEQDIAKTLQLSARHAVIPVVLRDSAEHTQPPGFGLAAVADAETGRRRLLFLRPSLNARLQAAQARFDAMLQQRFSAHGMRALRLNDTFEADQVTQYFLGQVQ